MFQFWVWWFKTARTDYRLGLTHPTWYQLVYRRKGREPSKKLETQNIVYTWRFHFYSLAKLPHICQLQVVSFLGGSSVARVVCTCQHHRDQLPGSQAFNKVCMEYTKRYGPKYSAIELATTDRIAELKAHLILTSRNQFAYQNGDYQTVERCLSGGIKGALAQLAQHALRNALSFILKQIQVQSASRWAFIFSKLTKHVWIWMHRTLRADPF